MTAALNPEIAEEDLIYSWYIRENGAPMAEPLAIVDTTAATKSRWYYAKNMEDLKPGKYQVALVVVIKSDKVEANASRAQFNMTRKAVLTANLSDISEVTASNQTTTTVKLDWNDVGGAEMVTLT